ncbi:MAG: DNA photolyase [Desulfobulbaceae bacterium]|nr:DNA photolyase [Desulfobulbaceae bacterium]
MGKVSWKDPSYFVNEIFVEESCVELEYTKEILERAQLPWFVVPDRGKPNDLDDEYVHNLSAGKKQLFLCRNRGQFFKPCPGTREYQCCDYQVLNTGANCPIDCVYCILQAYLNSPWLIHYVNTEQLFAELKQPLSKSGGPFYRIGTGEFTDSLALDRITKLSSQLVPFVAKSENAILELKTKSGVIENLEHLDHRGKTVIAWSLNSPLVMKEQEIRSATLDERLEAAGKCAQWGYKLAFHFDPIIEYSGWQDAYVETIERLYSAVPAESIVWISLGALRYLPKLKEIGALRFPSSRIYFNEFILGLDGKQRYFRPSRTAMYSHIYKSLKEKAADNTCIYFCMESDEIWQEVMGFTPKEKGGLPKMLDDAVQFA